MPSGPGNTMAYGIYYNTRIGTSSTCSSRPLVSGKKELMQTQICMKHFRSCSWQQRHYPIIRIHYRHVTIVQLFAAHQHPPSSAYRPGMMPRLVQTAIRVWTISSLSCLRMAAAPTMGKNKMHSRKWRSFHRELPSAFD